MCGSLAMWRRGDRSDPDHREETRGAQRGRGPREGHQRERGDTTARPTVFTSAPNQIESVAGS